MGKYLRSRYNGFISSLYLPDETVVRTTEFARTKMTALTLLAALYHPPPAQRWNSFLNWQPVPYNTLPRDEDDVSTVFHKTKANTFNFCINAKHKENKILLSL